MLPPWDISYNSVAATRPLHSYQTVYSHCLVDTTQNCSIAMSFLFCFLMHTTLLEVATKTNSGCFTGHCGPYDTQGAVTWETICWGGGGGGGPRSLWTIPGGCGYRCFWPYSVTGRGYSDLQGRLHSAPRWGLTERRNHSNGTTTQQGVDFHSLITKKYIANAQSSHTTTGVRLYLFICYHGNMAAMPYQRQTAEIM